MGGNHVLPAECGLQPLDAVAAPFVKSSVFLYVHHVLMCSRQNHSDYTDLVMCNLPLDACRVQPVGNRFIPAMKEVQTEKLKGAATTAATNIAESVGSLFGSNKVKTLERENTALYREVVTHEETIEILQNRIHTMQTEHNRQLLEIQQNHRKEMAEKSVRHKDEVSGLKRIIEKLCAWFPMAKEIMSVFSACGIGSQGFQRDFPLAR